jgi:AcrR family transcriptional regulator
MPMKVSSQRVPPSPRLRDRLREEAGRAILAAAEEAFVREGLGARMEDIAARAGVAVGTLYNHFEDRKALVAALVRSRREALIGRLDGTLAAKSGAPVAEQLGAYLAAVEEHARAHGPLLGVLMQAGEGPGEARPPKTLHDDLVRRADQIVARGIEAGELRPDGARVFGLALVGMARAVLVRAIEGGAAPGEPSTSVLDLFLRGATR